MDHYGGNAMSHSTKEDILDTLMALLNERPLDEITVKDLTERCGISRQAFYYHFSDIYAVVDFGVHQEFDQLDFEEDWYEVLSQVGDKLRENRTVVLNTYRAFERSYVERYLDKWFRPVMEREVRRAAEHYHVTEQQIDFVTELFKMGIVDVVLGWLDHGLTSRVKEYFDDFYTVFSGSIGSALERLEQKNLSGKN
jgi:AcrR family transcriptional regulator